MLLFLLIFDKKKPSYFYKGGTIFKNGSDCNSRCKVLKLLRSIWQVLQSTTIFKTYLTRNVCVMPKNHLLMEPSSQY